MSPLSDELTSAADAGASHHGVARRVFRPEHLRVAETAFAARCPNFDPDGRFTLLRRSEYGRLDEAGQVYLDYTGGGLHAASQIDAHAELLRATVLGNPHSNNPTSAAATELVERTRRRVCEFFNAPPEEYTCIFTANASAALRLVGESYPFARGGTYALTCDNHNSVNGIREFARRNGAAIAYLPVVAPELRLDRTIASRVLATADRSAPNLLAFPAQSNFSGVQHPLDLVEEAHASGWDVLVDAAAFVPTSPLDVASVRPDFVTLSFYKMMGFPTGVGCLLARRSRLAVLKRPWFAGGTITIASVQGDGHYLHPDEAGFEDGTVDYLNLPAVSTGLDHLERVGRAATHDSVGALTAWLLEALTGLRHANGNALVAILGPTDSTDRGGTISFQVHDRDGRPVDDRRIEELANEAGISLRTGCFCNPGAGEIAHGLGASDMRKWFARRRPMSFLELRDSLMREHDILVGAVRISLGLASTFGDVYRFMCFLQVFVDRTVDEIGRLESASDNCRFVRDSA
jgi:molybdenum cofactor sulfurtransferase